MLEKKGLPYERPRGLPDSGGIGGGTRQPDDWLFCKLLRDICQIKHRPWVGGDPGCLFAELTDPDESGLMVEGIVPSSGLPAMVKEPSGMSGGVAVGVFTGIFSRPTRHGSFPYCVATIVGTELD